MVILFDYIYVEVTSLYGKKTRDADVFGISAVVASIFFKIWLVSQVFAKYTNIDVLSFNESIILILAISIFTFKRYLFKGLKRVEARLKDFEANKEKKYLILYYLKFTAFMVVIFLLISYLREYYD